MTKEAVLTWSQDFFLWSGFSYYKHLWVPAMTTFRGKTYWLINQWKEASFTPSCGVKAHWDHALWEQDKRPFVPGQFNHARLVWEKRGSDPPGWDQSPYAVKKTPSNYRNITSTMRLRPHSTISILLFQNRNTQNRWYLCSFGSDSIFGMNGISFRSFCSQYQNKQYERNTVYSE